MNNKNLTWHSNKIVNDEKEKLFGHKSACIWLTGLSGSGKSTIAVELETYLFSKGVHSFILDGDNVRLGLNSDLGFSDEDRTENIRRVGEAAKLFYDAGLIIITAFISPFQKDREFVRNLFKEKNFIEVYVNCSLNDCEKRDPKKLYAKARKGEISKFTGINSLYEIPKNPEIIINNNDTNSISENVGIIVEYLKDKEVINL